MMIAAGAGLLPFAHVFAGDDPNAAPLSATAAPFGFAASAAPAQPAGDNSGRGSVIVPAGTAVDVVLSQDVSDPKSAVVFRVAADVYSANQVLLIPEGTLAYGRSLHVDSLAGRGGGIDLRCNYILTSDGTRLSTSSADAGSPGWSKRTVSFLPDGSGDGRIQMGAVFGVLVDKDTKINNPAAVQTNAFERKINEE